MRYFKVPIEPKVVIVNVPWFPLPLEKSAEIDVEIENEKIILKRMEQI